MPRRDPQPPRTATIAPGSPAAPERAPHLRDQQRALHAYQVVGELQPGERKGYAIAVNGCGANILRNGLSAALATIHRQDDAGARHMLDHIARHDVPGLHRGPGSELFAQVRKLEIDDYMMATREILQLVTWLKRAAQAIPGGS